MEFTADKQDLKKALSKLSRAVEARSPKEIMKSVLIEAEENGEITMSTVGGLMRIREKIRGTVSEAGCIAPEFQFLANVIGKTLSDEVRIKAENSSRITLEAEESVFRFKGFPPDEFPRNRTTDKKKQITISETNFIEMIKSVLYAKSDDETREILTGANFEVLDGVMTLVTVDGFKMGISRTGDFSSSESSFSIVVNGALLLEATRIFQEKEGTLLIYTDGNRIVMDDGITEVTGLLLEGEFVDYKRMIPQDMPLKIKIEREKLLLCAEKTLLFNLTVINSPVKLEFSGNILAVETQSAVGRYNDRIGYSVLENSMPDGLTIGFNGKYLAEVLKAIDDEEIVMELKNGTTGCMFRPVTGNSYTHFLMPVQLRF